MEPVFLFYIWGYLTQYSKINERSYRNPLPRIPVF